MIEDERGAFYSWEYQLDTARVLRYTGLRDQIHPLDAVACTYDGRAHFDESSRRDREIHENAVHGPWVTEAGLVAIIDLRPQLERMGCAPTDPALPDDIPQRWERNPLTYS